MTEAGEKPPGPCRSANGPFTARSKSMAFKLACLSLLLYMGCLSYSFTGSLPSHIRSVAVPLFEDNTAYPGVREDLTNRVIEQFISDNTLQVTSESQADLIISGVITSITQRAAILSAGETVDEYQVFVNVKVKCEDIKSNKTLWEKNLSEFGVMTGSGSQDEHDQAIQIAIEKLTNDIFNNTLGYW